MTNTDEIHDAEPHLRPLLERVAARAQAERTEIALAFARAAFRRVPAERLARLDLDASAAWIADAAAFMDARAPGELALRVYDATVATHGWTSDGTVVEVNVEDSPFLLSTVIEQLAALGLDITETIHPVIGVEREEEGRIARILPARRAHARESCMHVRLGARLAPERREEVADALRTVLEDARRASRDLPAMRAQVREVAFQVRATAGARYPLDEVDELIAFLEWLLHGRFSFLGYREYDLVPDDDGTRAVVVRPGSGLGILADTSSSTYAEPVPLASIAPDLRARIEGGDLLLVSRTNRLSTVHRRERLVYVGVKKVAPDGQVAGEYRFLGLFSHEAQAEPASAVPILRRKLRTILEREDIVEHSHDERAVRALFEAVPKLELFAADTEQLRRTVVDLLESQARQQVRLLARTDPQGRSVSAFVALPRERFTAEIRKRIQELLVGRFDGVSVDYHLSITERDQALLLFVIHARQPGRRIRPLAPAALQALEREVVDLVRSWVDELRSALTAAHGETEGERLAARWASRFPPGYAQTVPPAVAVADIIELEAVLADPGGMRMRLTHDPQSLRVRLVKRGPGIELSGFLPILESLGLVVTEEVPYRLDRPADEPEIHIHDFGVRPADDLPSDVDITSRGETLTATALAVWRGDAEADSLNRLVLTAGLDWQAVAVLRAYRRYRRQIGTSFTEAYQNQALSDHPEIARGLTELFAAKFDPGLRATPEEIAVVRQRVLAELDTLERLDTDRILRGYLALVDATTRTNRYCEPRRGWLALKLDSHQVPEVGKPVPHAEIFVYAPGMEGIHLRGAPVARGGIRWSDRLEDFRTEIHGLMKAQLLKNAVIVPSGAKGGFVVKRAPRHADLREEVRQRYEQFIRALLDVTDNVVAGKVIPPERVRRVDGDDPYLVVAADRGTAAFSDLANVISAEYGFWLGDAFASGGSHGYDHKAMGITARGAWVAVQRHFRELDLDVQTDPITVVGIGDMSGDVFGNGMLQSRALRLVAAFDHRDVFLDPDPNPEVAYAERQRLFRLPRSSWQDYDRAKISAGGGVWSRTVKTIPLSPEVRQALRVDADELSPPELIRAILAAPVDLLFAGGIGTFVKASSESHAAVGDRANDAVRVDADQVKARVVGEGGNLAFTQRARIQYARRGGRCNTDAIDNAAGVDTSDHEVNLKILLQIAIEQGALAAGERDALLAAVRDDVAAAVLRDVALQTAVLSQEQAFSPGGMEAYEQVMTELEAAGTLDREVEALPSTEEVRRRREAGAGLTRPELAVLLGAVKVNLRDAMLTTDVPDEPALQRLLATYFPAPIRERFADLLPAHRLRRELVATMLANDVVNRMGITFVSRTVSDLGADVPAVLRAYWAAREITGADEHWRAVEALDARVDPLLQRELKAEIDRLVDACTRAYTHEGEDLAAVIDRDRPAFQQLQKAVSSGLGAGRQTARRHRAERLVDLGIEPAMAETLASLADLTLTPDVAAVAREHDQPVDHVAEVFFALSVSLPLDRLHQRLRQLDPGGHWQRWQQRGLIDELRLLRRMGASAALAAHPAGSGSDIVTRFLASRAAARERVEGLMVLLEREERPGLDAIAVVVRALRDVLA